MSAFSGMPLHISDMWTEDERKSKKRPEGIVERAVPPWILQGRWRVIPLSRGHTDLFPPEPYLLSDEWNEDDPGEQWLTRDDLLGSDHRLPTVVLGAPGMGLSSLTHWAKTGLGLDEGESGGHVVLDLARLGEASDPSSQRRALAEAWSSQVLPKDAARLDSDDPAVLVDAFLKAGDPHSPSTNSPRSHLLLHADMLHEKNAERLFGRLRDLVENYELESARILILAFEKAKVDVGPFSDFLSVCRVCRLADLSEGELEYMWRCWRPPNRRVRGKRKDDEATRAVATACRQWTGGHPLLANLYLQQLAERPNLSPEEAGNWLLHHPPSIVKRWQEDLGRILLSSQRCLRRMDALVDGSNISRGSVGQEDLPLYLAGWIGPHTGGERWGVRSAVHAKWAEGPVEDPKGFAKGRRRTA